MSTHICQLPMIPLRSEASHKSEQSTQLLFGEELEIIAEEREWVKVKAHFDQYEGWVELQSLTEIKESADKSLVLSAPVTAVLVKESNLYLPAGSKIPVPDSDGNFYLNNIHYRLLGNIELAKKTAMEYALDFLGAPYLWGGRTIMGIDCSGLSQLVFKLAGIPILRDASQQAEMGQAVIKLEEARPNDLLFFVNGKGQITHVGIYMGEGSILHASGSVRIDKIDHRGIYREETKNYTHRLKSIRRI